MKKNLAILLMLVMCLGIFVGCSQATEPVASEETSNEIPVEEPKEAAAVEVSVPSFEPTITANSALKATGFMVVKFKEEQDEDWADNITKLYLHDKSTGESIVAEDLLPDDKYIVSTVKMMIDSDLFEIEREGFKDYQVVIQSEGKEDFGIDLTVKNYTPNTFTIRTIDSEGNVLKQVDFTYEEMEAMSVTEQLYSNGCVMHGFSTMKGQGIYLSDLLKKAEIEFSEGMSLATRATDAPTEIQVVDTYTSQKTGEVFENPERYWMKPRFTDNFKFTYENLYGRERYFVTSPWEDEEVKMAADADGGKFKFELREILASKKEYMTAVEPMIALKYSELQYRSNPEDPRTYNDPNYDLTANERAFRFLFGQALDDDPTVNVLSYDKEEKRYPLVENPENEGKEALEEGADPCGNAGRSTKLLFGIDIFVGE